MSWYYNAENGNLVIDEREARRVFIMKKSFPYGTVLKYSVNSALKIFFPD
jgi:hypothetical protein